MFANSGHGKYWLVVGWEGITLPETRPCIRPGQVSSQGKLPGHGVTAGEAWAAATTIINKPRTCLALQIIMSQTQPIYINPTHFTLNTIYTNHTCHQKLFLDHIPIVKR